VRELVEAGKLVNAKYWKNKGTTIDRENFTVPNINLSGILAISCAILEEFDEIYLWGFDGGGGTWFDSRVTNYQADITRFNNQYRNLLTPGVQIVNMINPDVPSKITCFDQCPLPTTLKV
jgi:hypothetical protein